MPYIGIILGMQKLIKKSLLLKNYSLVVVLIFKDDVTKYSKMHDRTT